MAFVEYVPLTAFLHSLDTDVAVGTRNAFLSALGRKLVLAHIIPEEDFAKTGPPSDADLGGLLNKLHALGPAVDWTAVITAHPDAVTFFATAGETVMGEIKTAMLMRAQAAGSGTHHKEIELREMLDYAEVQQTVASPEMPSFRDALAARNLAAAQAMMTTGSTFAKNMRRASLFAAAGSSKVVPKTEPCRADLNDAVRTFEALSGEHTRIAITRCLPGEADLLAPAIDETRRVLLGFANSTAQESVTLMMKAAGMLLNERREADTLAWGAAKVQLALRAVTTILECMIGPCMGLGCPDRCAAMLQEWAVWDDRFKHWAATFSTPSNISPAWHFAKLIILAPMAKWLGRTWLHWCGPSPHPGTLSDWLSEAALITSPHHNLMSQEITKIRLQHAASTANDVTSDSSSDSDTDTVTVKKEAAGGGSGEGGGSGGGNPKGQTGGGKGQKRGNGPQGGGQGGGGNGSRKRNRSHGKNKGQKNQEKKK